MGKFPLLQLLKRRFPHKSERELFAAVLRGDVYADGEKLLKPGALVNALAELSLRAAPRFVSRGGEKLAHALALWGLEVKGRVFLDAGCSTGGFTDCLLQSGASLVYGVDVGYNQLDWRLRSDPRVVVKERTNVMDLSPSDFSPTPDQAVVDLSFRSLRRAASHILDLTEEGRGVFLVKPQFEWKDPTADFHGVVEGSDRILAILGELLDALVEEGVSAVKATPSPITGRRGNREYLFLFARSAGRKGETSRRILERLVTE